EFAGKRKDRTARRRLAAALATSVLVLRTSRGLYRDPAGIRDRVASDRLLRTQAHIGIQGHTRLHARHWVPQLCGLGTPHVRQWDESVFGISVFDSDHHHFAAVHD